MQDFITHFVRIESGKWTCVRPGEFHGPNGRIQVAVGATFTKGTNFMGVDLADRLDTEYQKKNGATSLQARDLFEAPSPSRTTCLL